MSKLHAYATLMQQLQFAQAHLTAYQAAAQFAPTEDLAQQEVEALTLNRYMYANLLAASLSNWLDYAIKPECVYDYPDDWGEYRSLGSETRRRFHHSKCPDCKAYLSETSGGAYIYTGENVSNLTGCLSYDYEEGGDDAFQQQSKDVCTQTDIAECSNEDFTTQYNAWFAKAQPAMLPWVRAFQIDFQDEGNASGQECACENGITAYSVTEANASSCQISCRADVNCRAFQFNALVDGVLNYSSSEIGTCSLFSCTLEAWSGCATSDQCPMSTSCRIGDPRCLTQADCEWANGQDGTARDCTAIPRSLSTDDGASCESSDECVGLASFCRVGDKRCVTDDQCDATTTDCTKMSKTTPAGTTFSQMSGGQNCVDLNVYARFEVADFAECMNYCGFSCNAVAFQGSSCVVYEACVPTVVWKQTGWKYFMKWLPTKAAEDQACAQVYYGMNGTTVS